MRASGSSLLLLPPLPVYASSKRRQTHEQGYPRTRWRLGLRASIRECDGWRRLEVEVGSFPVGREGGVGVEFEKKAMR